MWNHVMCFARRYTCEELLKAGVVDAAPPASELLSTIEMATEMKGKGKDAKTRETMHGIKNNLYKDAILALGKDVEDMRSLKQLLLERTFPKQFFRAELALARFHIL